MHSSLNLLPVLCMSWHMTWVRSGFLFKVQQEGGMHRSVCHFVRLIMIGDQLLANCVWSAEDLARHPAVGGALCGGWACVALASRKDGVKVEVNAISIHEVTVDDVVHVTIKVFSEHVYVQVCGQSVLTSREAGLRSKLTHPLQTHAGIG